MNGLSTFSLEVLHAFHLSVARKKASINLTFEYKNPMRSAFSIMSRNNVLEF
jgi:hypothetical protein